ncbi:DUF4116 domain-containing protein [Roseateles sp. PN1]|uniref:DUF4116 domain-containing protein n=1 Tax=Roseateles sp. PN1 TaxID=3137372 RepID=UPI003138F182
MTYKNRDAALKKLTEDVDVRLFASKKMDKFRGDKEFVLEIVKVQGKYLADASYQLQADKEVVLEAVKQNPHSIWFASSEIQEICKDKDPAKALESHIAHEKLQSTLAQKSSAKRPTQSMKI